jgi:hypothetical protein
MKKICRDCHHPEEVHNVDRKGTCACGCIRLTPIDRAAREARLRTWLVDVEFFVRNRWIAAPQERVKAGGHGGAAMKGVRAAKVAALRPRQRVQHVRITLTPVPRGG